MKRWFKKTKEAQIIKKEERAQRKQQMALLAANRCFFKYQIPNRWTRFKERLQWIRN